MCSKIICEFKDPPPFDYIFFQSDSKHRDHVRWFPLARDENVLYQTLSHVHQTNRGLILLS